MGIRELEKDEKRCQCGYCGAISPLIGDGTTRIGVIFKPKSKRQKYVNKNHYLRHQYNGKKPLKKKCSCGCSRYFYTIDKKKDFIKGHENNIQHPCEACRKLIDYSDLIFKDINGNIFKFCQKCMKNIYK